MNVIRNVLAVIGIVAIVALAIVGPKALGYKAQFDKLDPKAMDVYMEMVDNLLASGNPAEATVWKVKAADGLSVDDVEQTLGIVANEHNFMLVDTLPFNKQVEGMTGEPYRTVKFYLLCDALIGRDMLEFSDAFSAYMPCRISLVEDKEGNIWLYTLNMDMMIYGGHPLPPALKKDAEKVKMIMLDVMNRAAAGEF